MRCEDAERRYTNHAHGDSTTRPTSAGDHSHTGAEQAQNQPLAGSIASSVHHHQGRRDQCSKSSRQKLRSCIYQIKTAHAGGKGGRTTRYYTVQSNTNKCSASSWTKLSYLLSYKQSKLNAVQVPKRGAPPIEPRVEFRARHNAQRCWLTVLCASNQHLVSSQRKKAPVCFFLDAM